MLDENKALVLINEAAKKANPRAPDIKSKQHIREDKLLDSLDEAVFYISLEQASGCDFCEERVERENLYQIDNIIAVLIEECS